MQIPFSDDARKWQRIARELRVDRIREGTSEIQRLIIARSLLKRGLDGM